MRYAYKVVPFIGQSKGALSATAVARQLENAIGKYARDGWEFYQLSDVNIQIQPGCISGLFGATVQYVRFDQLIFRGDASVVATSIAGPDEEAESELPLQAPNQSEYRPTLLPNGKVKCWACGETNYPNQEKCWDCFSPLYEKR